VTNACDKVIFADDTNLLFHHENFEGLNLTLNHELEKISEWFRANKLSINTNKTKCVYFNKSSSAAHGTLNVKLQNEVIEVVKSIKFLGILLSHDLSWTEHVTTKGTKIAYVNSILYRLKHMLPEQNLLQIYHALISPHLSYGIEAWGNAPNSVLKRLLVLQKKAMRIISMSSYNSHTNPIFKKYKILKVPDIFQLHCAKLFYRTKLNSLPTYHSSKLTTAIVNERTTRQNHDIYIHRINSNLQKQCLNFKVGHSWNNLPIAIKSLHNISLHTFSRKVKNHLLSLYDTNCTKINCFSCQQAAAIQT